MHRINRKTLRLIYREINKLLPVSKQLQICFDSGVSEELVALIRNEGYDESQILFNILTYLSTSSNPVTDLMILYMTIENLVNPEYNNLARNISLKLTKKFNKLLKYNALFINWSGTWEITDNKTQLEWPQMFTFDELGWEYDEESPNELIGKKIHDEKIEVDKPVSGTAKLLFYAEDGITTFKTAEWTLKRGGKGFALLNFLSKNKNTPFSLEELKEKCNSQISLKNHWFRKEKDLRDTISHIKNKLKVSKSEYFPIFKNQNLWIWQEK